MEKNSIELLDSITTIMYEKYINSFSSKQEKDYFEIEDKKLFIFYS